MAEKPVKAKDPEKVKTAAAEKVKTAKPMPQSSPAKAVVPRDDRRTAQGEPGRHPQEAWRLTKIVLIVMVAYQRSFWACWIGLFSELIALDCWLQSG